MTLSLVFSMLISLLTSILVTPIVIKVARKFGIMDKPDSRKVHKEPIPRFGGLAILLAVVVGYFTSGLYQENITGISVAGIVILLIGILDDKYQLSARVKLLGQLIAASIVVYSGLTIDFLHIPFIGRFDLALWSYPVTIFWILGITNAINLIDGLDGLAAGISSIVIGTIAILAALNGKMLILTISIILLGSIIGFLFYNFYPAKIFMGDTGALFLGYCISVISLLGLYKSVTLFSFIVPIIILGVPVFDTLFAILRRLKSNKPIMQPDKGHLHHRLMMFGLSHRNTVLFMYCLSIAFSITGIVFSRTILWGTILFLIAFVLLLEILRGKFPKKQKSLYRRLFGKQ